MGGRGGSHSEGAGWRDGAAADLKLFQKFNNQCGQNGKHLRIYTREYICPGVELLHYRESELSTL